MSSALANLPLNYPKMVVSNTVELNDRTHVPILGYGTATHLFGKGAKDSVKMAYKEANVRHIDTAACYGNEASAGAAVKELGLRREDVFLTTKSGEYLDPRYSLEESLKLLGVDYVDLYLIHSPMWVEKIGLANAWREMEELQAEGKARSIGVSNYRISDLEETLKTAKVIPCVNQIEVHPYVYDRAKPLIEYCQSKGIRMATYTSLAPIVHFPGGPVDAVVQEIARELGITDDQVLLKWAHQVSYGGIAVTSSRKKDRLLGQIQALTEMKNLSEEQVQEIATAGSEKHQRVYMSGISILAWVHNLTQSHDDPSVAPISSPRLGITDHFGMALQLRMLRAGPAISRFTSRCQHIQSCPVLNQSHLNSSQTIIAASPNSSHIRTVFTDSRPERSKSFGFKKRNEDEQHSKRKYERAPRSEYGLGRQRNGRNADGDQSQRQQGGFVTARPRDRSASYQTGGRFERTEKPFARRESGYKGKDKTFSTEGSSYAGNGGPTKTAYASQGYKQKDRPSYIPRRENRDVDQTDTPTPRQSSEIEKRLRIRPGTSPYDASVHLNNFIRNSRRSKEQGRTDVGQSDYLEVAEEIVKTAPRESVNIAVWNVLLSGFAKERKYQRMFKTFNDMKKRGIRPSSRTYAIMLDNYPSSFDAPSKTLSKATLLYDQAQEHVKGVLDQIAEAKEVEGYELASARIATTPSAKHAPSAEDAEKEDEKERLTIDAYTSGNAVAPTNAYLAQMSHFSRFDEVKRVYEAMPKEGPLAPDNKTYSILFEANMALGAKRGSKDMSADPASSESAAASGTQPDDKEKLIDPVALWKEIIERDGKIRRKLGKRGGEQSPRSGPRLMDEQQTPLIDERLVITVLRSLMAGTMEERTFALEAIVPTVYNLSAPGRSSYSSMNGASQDTIPRFELTERAVETILKLCLAAGRTQEGVHYAEQILNLPTAFTNELGLTHYNAMLALYSKINDVNKCLEILDTKPPFLQGQGWPRSSWIYVLKAAKFAGDWDKFMVAFKRMTRMPTDLESADKASPPIGNSEVDDQIATLLLSTATATKRVSAMRDAMRVLAYYYSGRKTIPKGTDETSTYSRYWRRQLLASAQVCLSMIEKADRDASQGRDVNEERAWRDLVIGLGSLERDRVPDTEGTRKQMGKEFTREPERARTRYRENVRSFR